MIYKLKVTPGFLKDLDKITPADKQRVLAGINKLRENFTACDFKKLKGMDMWRLRVGNYRVLCKIELQSRILTIILVLAVGHRKDIYK